MIHLCSEKARSSGEVAEGNQKRYRCLQLLQSRANTTFSLLVATHQALFVLATIRNIYGALNAGGYASVIHLCSSLGAITYLFVAFKTLGRVHVKSQAVLMTWRNSRQDEYARRVSRSLRPLRFEVWTLYYVDPGMVLTMGMFIIEKTVSLLLVQG